MPRNGVPWRPPFSPLFWPGSAAARFVTFGFRHASDPGRALVRLAAWQRDPNVVVGLGEPLLARAKGRVEGARLPGGHLLFPRTQEALWAAFTHPDRGAAFDAGRAFSSMLGDGLRVVEEVDAFMYRGGKDLSGFVDGTENPKAEAAVAAAIIDGRGPASTARASSRCSGGCMICCRRSDEPTTRESIVGPTGQQ